MHMEVMILPTFQMHALATSEKRMGQLRGRQRATSVPD